MKVVDVISAIQRSYLDQPVDLEGTLVLRDDHGVDLCWIEDDDAKHRLDVENASEVANCVDRQPVPKLGGGDVWFVGKCRLRVQFCERGSVRALDGEISPHGAQSFGLLLS